MVIRYGFLAVLIAAGFGALSTLPNLSGQAFLTVLDVGQGDSIYARDGAVGVLVDTGNPGSGAVGKAGGPVSLLVLTHLERDHAGDAAATIRAASPGAVLFNGRTDASSYEALAEASDAAGTPLVAVVPGDVLRFGASRLTVLGPQEAHRTSANHNDSSLVLRADFPEFSALLTGDATVELESTLDHTHLDVDVLKVGHHGSKTSSGEDFLDAVQPGVALVSLGEGNSYGHPAPEVVDRFAARGIPVFRTDREGSITVRASGGQLLVSTSSVR